MKKQSWNPLEILNDFVDGKIFDGEFSPEQEVTHESRTETTRAPAGEPEQAKAKRKPAADALAETFTGGEPAPSAKPGAVVASIASAAPATEGDGGEGDGAA